MRRGISTLYALKEKYLKAFLTKDTLQRGTEYALSATTSAYGENSQEQDHTGMGKKINSVYRQFEFQMFLKTNCWEAGGQTIDRLRKVPCPEHNPSEEI
jgi:hypothetical protein